jgi:hypothetical protein
MDRSVVNTGSGSSSFGLLSVIFTVAGLIAIYFLYDFLYSAPTSKLTMLVPGQHNATELVKDPPTIPPIFEGGDYSFSTWIYISSYHRFQDRVKHVFELKGKNHSTLLVGLGAGRNSVVIRTHTKNISESFVEGFQGSNGEGGGAITTTSTTAETTELGKTQLEDMFKPAAQMAASASGVQPKCDLAEVDLQRWVHLAVIMSGRTIDVYLDGKLARSCVMHSYFKVDPTGVAPVLCDKGGFDGYIASTAVANYAMNPGEIYRTYISGPEGTSNNIVKWFGSLFTGA